MQHRQPIPAIQRAGLDAQPFQIAHDIRLHAPQPGTRLRRALSGQAKGKVRDRRLYLVAPHIPAGRGLPCEQLHAGQIAHEGNDLITGFIRLFAVGFNGRNDKLMNVGGLPFGVSLGCQQANLGVGPRPEAQPIKPTVRLAVFFSRTNATDL